MGKHIRGVRNHFPASFLPLILALAMTVFYSGCGGSEVKYKITGVVTIGGAAFPGVTVTLSGNSLATTTTDANGNFSFIDLASGTYTVTPSLAGYTFSPSSRPAYLLGNDAIGWNFAASVPMSTHSVYLKSDGTVWAWGNNYYGQFGNAKTASAVNSTPVQIAGLSDVSYVVAGGQHSVFLKKDGTVWTSGLNSNGQLGDGTTIQRSSPVQVGGLTNVTAVSVGDAHTVALRNDGTVWAWGKNSNGQLGDGAIIQRNSPVQVTGLTNVTAIDAGDDFTVALRSDGTVWAWGNNSNGQLGDGTTTQKNSPVQVPSAKLPAVANISAGSSFIFAVANDGAVWAWGSNSSGQFCNGTTAATNATPVQVAALAGAAAVVAGYDHTAIVKNDTTVWSCGSNASGQLGNGAAIPGASSSTLVQATGLTGVTALAAGNQGTLAVMTDGTLRSWGSNTNGQLGDKTTVSKSSPVQVQF